MATKLADAYVQIIPSAKGITGSISNALGGEAESAGASAGNSIASNIKKVIAAAGIGAAITSVVKSAFSEGQELQQNLGGTEAVFGQYAQTIQDYATDAYKNMGLSASDYMATANKMGSLFQGSGLEQERAMELTSAAMQRAADVASVMGLDTTAAMESIAGAAKGNFTMMDNLGVAMNATTLEAYALEKGLNFEWKTASNAEKAELAMEMFFDRTSQYANNFARESEDTVSGSLGAMSAAWKNVLGNLALGNDIMPSLFNLEETAFTYLRNNFFPMLGNILSGLPAILGEALSAGIRGMNLITHNAPGILKAGTSIVTNLAASVIRAIPYLVESAYKLITSFGSALLSGDWIETAGGIIDDLKNDLVVASWEIFGNDNSIFENVKTALSNIDWKQAATDLMTKLKTGIHRTMTILTDALGFVGNTAFELFKSIDWVSLGSAMITLIKDGIALLSVDIPQAITDIGNTAITWFESVDWAATGSAIIGLLGDGISILTEDIPGLIKDIGLAAIEWFKKVDWLSAGLAIIGFICDGINTVLDSIPTAIQSIGNTAAAWFQAIEWAEVGKTILALIKAGLQLVFYDIPKKLLEIGGQAVDYFKAALWGESGKGIISKIIDGIKKVVSDIPNKLLEIAGSAITFFKSALWSGSGKDVITKIVNGIKNVITDIPNKLLEIGGNAVTSFKSVLWGNSGKEVISKIVNGIKNVITDIPNKLLEIAGNAITFFKQGLWKQSGKDIITKIVNGIKEFFSKIPDKLLEIVKDAIAKITDIETWKQVGKDIVNGIVDGIKSIPGAIGGALKSAVGAAVNGVKGAFGIHSPSTVFRDEIGKPIAWGITEGFDQGIAGLTGDMVGSVERAKNAVAADMAMNYTVSGQARQLETMPGMIAEAVLDGVQQIADGVERGIGKMKMVANNRETARFVADLGFARA